MTGGGTEALLCARVALQHHGQPDRRRCVRGGGCQSVTEVEDNDDDDDDEDTVDFRDATVLMTPPPD